MSDRVIDVDNLVGGEFDFYGAADQRFNLDGLIYEVDDDGNVTLSDDHSGFHELPIARVVVEYAASNYELIDLHDGHCWLCFGEELIDVSRDRYSTQFVFDYSPKVSEDDAHQ